MNKKLFSFIVALGLCLTLGIGALAQEEKSIELDGLVQAKQSLSVLAPAAGVLGDHSLTLGQRVEEGEGLFTLETQKTYAPWSGTIRGIKVNEGQNIQTVLDRYTAVFYIDPVEAMKVDASSSQAYNEEENKRVYPGEEVFILSTSTKDRSALGTVTLVEGNTFTVEIDPQENSLRLNERVGIYRDRDHDGKSRIGYGVTGQTPLIAIIGSGSLVALHVQEGQRVEKDDLLFETLAASQNRGPLTTNQVTAPVSGIITALAQAGGSEVAEDQLLATIADDSTLEIIANLGQSDYGALQVGDSVTITFDAYSDEKPLKGTVSAIAAFSATDAGEKEYEVKINFTPTKPLPLGLEATVTITH